MKKFFKIVFVIILLMAATLAGLIFVYTKTTDYGFEKLPENTSVNGIDCSGLSYDDAAAKLSREWNNRRIIITDSFNSVLGSFTDFGFKYDISSQLEGLKKEYIIMAAANHYLKIPFDVSIAMIVSEYSDTFKEKVLAAPFLNKSNVTLSKDAYVDTSDPDFPIIKEVYGTKPDGDKFFRKLIHKIEAGQLHFIFDEKQYYSMPEITSESEELIQYQTYCRKYLKQRITYELGSETFTISPEQLDALMLDDYSGEPDKEAVKEYVSQLADKYDNVGITREFTSFSGKAISVSGGTYGWEIARKDETEQLIKDISSHEDVTRKPVYYLEGYGEYTNTMGDTYIDVDISKQVVKFYKDGTLVFSSKCVTGCRSTGHDTDIGSYYILNKVRDVVLRGDNGDGTQYESPVKYWLGVTWSGQGFHDADWRQTFGGSIWKNNGSHGCINMPPSKMPQLYELTETGTPVIMHY